MTTVGQCWDHYVQHHLPSTEEANANSRYWGRLCWFQHDDAETLSLKRIAQYMATRKGVSNATLSRELTMLRACLKHAEHYRLIGRAPYVKLPPKSPPKMEVLTKEQAAALVYAADTRGQWQEQVYIRLALGTGARPGAICGYKGLKWEQVTTDTIDFRIGSTPRMKRRSIIPLGPMLHAGLEIARRHRNGAYVLHHNGSPISSPRAIVRRLGSWTGLTSLSPHVLRHTVVSILLQEGWDILKVSRLIGHADSRTTETVYFQHQPTWLKDATNILDFSP